MTTKYVTFGKLDIGTFFRVRWCASLDRIFLKTTAETPYNAVQVNKDWAGLVCRCDPDELVLPVELEFQDED